MCICADYCFSSLFVCRSVNRRTYELHDLIRLIMEIEKERLNVEINVYLQHKVCVYVCACTDA
jgi:hypothetical protein